MYRIQQKNVSSQEEWFSPFVVTCRLLDKKSPTFLETHFYTNKNEQYVPDWFVVRIPLFFRNFLTDWGDK